MRKLTIIGMILSLLLLSVIAGVYAHGQQEDTELDYMDEIHEEMLENIDDPELREIMDEMHEGCEQFHEENSKIAVRSFMGMGMM